MNSKPGWQTSELWNSTGSAVAFLYFAAESSDWHVQVAGLVCAALVTVAYALSRGTAKKVAS